MTITIWLSLLLICLLGAMSPGPSLAVVAKHSLSGGRWHGIVCAWAHACGMLRITYLTWVSGRSASITSIIYQCQLCWCGVFSVPRY